MKAMINGDDTDCPFEFNFDSNSFKVGDIVSYRIPEAFDEMPFVGQLIEVGDDYVILEHYGELGDNVKQMRGTREGRPVVSESEALD